MAMEIEDDGATLRLSGACGAGEAEAVAGALAKGARRVVLDGVTRLDAAVLDALIAARPEVVRTGAPGEVAGTAPAGAEAEVGAAEGGGDTPEADAPGPATPVPPGAATG